MQQLKIRITAQALLIMAMVSCSEEGPKSIDKADLYGSWQLSVQTIGAKQYNEYVQIHTAVDITTSAVLWSDTIYFGSTTFMLRPCGDPCVIMGADILSASVRPLKGSWLLEGNEPLLKIQAIASPQMNEDTIINTHRYAFFDFVNNLTFTVTDVGDDQLELRSGNNVFQLNRKK